MHARRPVKTRIGQWVDGDPVDAQFGICAAWQVPFDVLLQRRRIVELDAPAPSDASRVVENDQHVGTYR
jgi:hypothetical protein